jgi:hypothetical protein
MLSSVYRFACLFSLKITFIAHKTGINRTTTDIVIVSQVLKDVLVKNDIIGFPGSEIITTHIENRFIARRKINCARTIAGSNNILFFL